MLARRNAVRALMVAAILAFFGVVCSACISEDVINETHDVQQYGQFFEDKNAAEAQRMFDIMFPPTLEPNFENVSYHYKSIDSDADTYSFEMELSFSIADHDTMKRYLEVVTSGKPCVPLPFNEEYQICFFTKPEFWVTQCSEGHYHIEESNILAVVFDRDLNSICYVALRVFDGGGTRTEELPEFFRRFSVDPVMFHDFCQSMKEEYQF